MQKVIAVLVIYNQNQAVFEKLVDSLINQVDQIILVDNSDQPAYQKTMQSWLKKSNNSHIYYVNLAGNHGIAYAQNQGVELAIKLKSQYLLLLDQDSLLPELMVKNLILAHQSLKSKNYNIACVSPSFIDKKINSIAAVISYKGLFRKRLIPTGHEEYLIADHVISSGSLIAVSDWLEIGELQADLFIDYVDTEWCLRAKKLGYTSFVIPKVTLIHDIGDGYIKVGTRNVVLHSDFRNYYMLRNGIYLILYSQLQYNFRLLELLKIPFYLFLYTLHSKNKTKTLKTMLIAIKDGIFKNMGKGYFKDK